MGNAIYRKSATDWVRVLSMVRFYNPTISADRLIMPLVGTVEVGTATASDTPVTASGSLILTVATVGGVAELVV